MPSARLPPCLPCAMRGLARQRADMETLGGLALHSHLHTPLCARPRHTLKHVPLRTGGSKTALRTPDDGPVNLI